MSGSVFWLFLAVAFFGLALEALWQKGKLMRTFSKKGGIHGSGFKNDDAQFVMPVEEFHKGLQHMFNTEIAASLLATAGAIFTFFLT